MKRCLLASSCLALAALPLGAAPLESARVTAAINKVLLAEPAAAPRPASLGDILRGRASLETGDKSRAELT
ncbi:MAG: hypothetical protein N2322_03415, partial [Terrimicrobiaceae bacterium]|nr:hypothetical protein [Terrimicrobiaceae bacterium]